MSYSPSVLGRPSFSHTEVLLGMSYSLSVLGRPSFSHSEMLLGMSYSPGVLGRPSFSHSEVLLGMSYSSDVLEKPSFSLSEMLLGMSCVPSVLGMHPLVILTVIFLVKNYYFSHFNESFFLLNICVLTLYFTLCTIYFHADIYKYIFMVI